MPFPTYTIYSSFIYSLYIVSLYNTSMKIIFITATIYTIYLMKFKPPYCYVNNL